LANQKGSNQQVGEWVNEISAKGGAPFKALGEGKWALVLNRVPVIVQNFEKNRILKFVVEFVEIPKSCKREFYEFLLNKNYSVPHGAYAILKEKIVFTDSLATADLDLSELIASLNSISMEVQYTLDFLKNFACDLKDKKPFEELIGSFTFADDSAKRVEALQMMKFTVGKEGIMNFLKSFKEFEGADYLPPATVEEVLK
jgi:hypothetical protein